DGSREPAAFVPVTVSYPDVQLTTTTQNLVEARQQVNSTFRFPLIRQSEVDDVEVVFADPEAAAAAGYQLDFDKFPSTGTLYVDTNGNDRHDRGEEVDQVSGTGFNGVQLVMRITGFHRVVVGDRDGQIRTPLFKPLEVAGGEQEAAAA